MSNLKIDISTLPQECVEQMQVYLGTAEIVAKEVDGGYKGDVLGVSCRVNCEGAGSDSSLVIVAARSLGDTPWNFGDCFPQLPGASEEWSPQRLFRMRFLTLKNSLWLFVWGRDVQPGVVRERVALTSWFKEWAEARGVADTSKESLKKLFDTLGFRESELQAEPHARWRTTDGGGKSLATDQDTKTSTSGLFLWGEVGQTSAIQSSNREVVELPWLGELEIFLGGHGLLDLRFAKVKVEPEGGFPHLILQLPPSGCDFGGDGLAFKNAAIYVSSVPYFTPQDTSVGLRGDFVFSGDKQIQIDLVYPIDGDLIWARGKYIGGPEHLLGDAASFGLPGEQPKFGADEEIELELEFSKSARTLTKLSFSIELHEKQWTLINQPVPLALEGVSFHITIFQPLDSSRMVLAQLTAEAAFGEPGEGQFRLVCGGSYPDGQLFLQARESLPVGSLIKKLVGPSEGIEKLTFDDLRIDYNYLVKTFALEMDVRGPWEIVSGLMIEDIRFRVEGTESYSGSLEAKLQIAKVDVQVSAQYKGEAGRWKFCGSTGPGQEIPIGKLIEDLGNLISNNKSSITLPAPLKDLIIENLRISFDTGNKDFKFTCESKFPVSGTEVDIVVAIDLTHKDGSYEHKFSGKITIGNYEFELFFGRDETAKLLLATYHHKNGSIVVSDLVSPISTHIAGLIPEGLSVNVKDVLFAYVKKDEEAKMAEGEKKVSESKWLFGIDLDIGAKLDFSGLPLVGNVIPADQTLGVNNLKFLATSGTFKKEELDNVNTIIPEDISKLPARDEAGLGKGFLLAAGLQFGQTTEEIIVGTAQPAKEKVEAPKMIERGILAASAEAPVSTTTEPLTPEAAGTPPSGNAKWLNVQKSFGPVRFKRVGLQYRDERVWFLLDAALSAAGLTISLDGLAVGSKLKGFHPTVNLDGLGLDYKNGPVQISGSLLKTSDLPEDVSMQYDGSVMVRAEAFTLSALGSYAVMKSGDTSLFVFAMLQKELGGPAFFFVTGLALGFGFNRTLKLPPIEEVQNYPLIKGATDPAYFGIGSDPGAAMKKLNDYINPSVGDCFLAAGVKFTSFGMIDSFAMLSVSFGTQFQIALLGLSRITVPKQTPGAKKTEPVACAELAIKVTFTPASGLLAAEARLTDNSYVFSKNCRLTGGFALYCWFAYEHEGDFVVTLGGYHPRFTRPDHYPVVPRLGIKWPVSSNLHVSGEAYFALTPSCLMAGGRLEAVYQSGDLRAWFCAFADFLINWKPFCYDIAIGVTIGASYRVSFFGIRKTLTVELEAQVYLWGPPFGGWARVKLYVISFTISFGQKRPEAPPVLEWQEFHQSFLPQSEDPETPLVNTIRITGGLICEKEIEGKNGKKHKLSVVNAHEFSLATESLIPSTCVKVNEKEDTDLKKDVKPLGIRPMGKTTLDSTHKVTFEHVKEENWKYLQYSLVRKNVPHALWSNDLKRLDSPSAETIKDVACGVTMSLKNREPSHELPPIDIEKFAYEDILKLIPWSEEVKPPYFTPAEEDNTLMNTINNSDVDGRRNKILNALALAKGENFYNDVNLPNLEKNAREIFQSEPEMAVLGQGQ